MANETTKGPAILAAEKARMAYRAAGYALKALQDQTSGVAQPTMSYEEAIEARRISAIECAAAKATYDSAMKAARDEIMRAR